MDIEYMEINGASKEPQWLFNTCGSSWSQAIFSVLLLLLISTCEQQQDDGLQALSPVASYSVNILETSDLCFGASTDVLFTVSDNSGKVYKMTTKGKVLSELSFSGNDLEGVCFVDNQFIYVAEERLRKIIKLDLQGNPILQKQIQVEANRENEGLEGISYASFNGHFFILNETNPGLLIETDKELNMLNTYPLSFADDYSGICVDQINQNLWIVSDLSATVSKCNLKGGLIKSYSIPVRNAEGIAFDPQRRILYVISDAEAKLYIFNIDN